MPSLARPDVDKLEHLTAAIVVGQEPMAASSRSTFGTATDITIQAENFAKVKKEMAELIAQHSGQTVEQIEKDSDRDKWFTAQEACDYGLFDHVIKHVPGTEK